MDDIQRSRYDVRPREVTFILEKEEEKCWELGQITCYKSEAALAEG